MRRGGVTGAVIITLVVSGAAVANDAQEPAVQPIVLKSEPFKHYIDSFNANDQELYPGYITKDAVWHSHH
jgi:hypothetical protein